MSNLLKSKFLLGVMVVTVMFVGVVAVSANTASADCSIMSTLRVGSSGAEVMCLQTIIGATADGAFGPMTKAAVMAYQASHGLTADGVVGPMSRASLMASGSVSGNFPAGCQSASGYSITTGMKCDSSNANTFPAGCTSASGYSQTTGMKCDASSSPSNPSGPVTGGAGSITWDDKSTYSGEDVLEGQEEAKVMAFEIEADDESDVAISSIKVELVQTVTTNSEDISDYLDSVTVWMNGEEVGSADASDFSENSDIYTKSISLDGAIVRAGDTEDFVISVNAQNSLDSGDVDDDAFTVDVVNVRFEDGDGVVTTENTDTSPDLQKSFDFDTLAASGDLEAKITENTASPEADSVEVDDTSDTNDVLLLAVNFKATGSDMTVDTLSFDITPTGANANEIVSEYKLLVDGEEIDSISATSIASTVTTAIQFTDLEDDFMVDEDDTVVIKLVADVKDLNGTFTTGDSIVASLTSTNFNATNTSIDDSNGDSVVNGDRTGSVTGETQTFYTDGIAVALDSVDADAFTVEAVNNDRVELSITFDVTAFGSDIYLPSLITVASAGTGSTGTAPTAAQGTGLHLQSSDAQLTTAKGSATLTSAGAQETAYTPTGTDATDNAYTSLFKVDEGSTETFTAKVNVSNAVATAGDLDDAQVRSILTGITFSNTNVIVTATTFVYTSNLQNDYKTAYATVAD
jgi:peptidoglycan hydrolase-like protein with peptidoglycan-binding domain